MQKVVVVAPTKNKPSRKRAQVKRPGGDQTLCLIEPMGTLKMNINDTTAITSFKFSPSYTGSVAKKYSEIYDNYRVKSVAYKFTSDTSDLANGNFSMGVDFNSADVAAKTLDSILKLTPHFSDKVSKTSGWMEVPKSMYNSNLVRTTTGTSTIDVPWVLYTATSTTVTKDATVIGRMEIKYDLEFSGLRP